jgi:hypothetical protein
MHDLVDELKTKDLHDKLENLTKDILPIYHQFVEYIDNWVNSFDETEQKRAVVLHWLSDTVPDFDINQTDDFLTKADFEKFRCMIVDFFQDMLDLPVDSSWGLDITLLGRDSDVDAKNDLHPKASLVLYRTFSMSLFSRSSPNKIEETIYNKCFSASYSLQFSYSFMDTHWISKLYVSKLG